MSNIEQAHSETPAHKQSKSRSHKEQSAPQRDLQNLNVELLQKEFYVALLAKLDEIGKKEPPKVEVPDNPYAHYSASYRSFAQANVSKNEGFATDVPLSDAYQATLNKLLLAKAKAEANK